jgi:hypothetical protein
VLDRLRAPVVDRGRCVEPDARVTMHVVVVREEPLAKCDRVFA